MAALPLWCNWRPLIAAWRTAWPLFLPRLPSDPLLNWDKVSQVWLEPTAVPHSGAGSLLRRRAALAAGVGPCSPLPVHDVSFVLCFNAEIMHAFFVSFLSSSMSSPSAGPDIPRCLWSTRASDWMGVVVTPCLFQIHFNNIFSMPRSPLWFSD